MSGKGYEHTGNGTGPSSVRPLPAGKWPFPSMLIAALLALAIAVPMAGNVAVAQSAGAAWQTETTRNPVKGGRILIASVTAQAVRAAVRCESASGWIDVRFFVDEPLATTTEQVVWAFDDGAATTQRWRISPNRGSLIVPTDAHDDFIDKLRRSRNLSLTLVTGAGERWVLAVPLAGSANAIGDVVRECR